MTRRTRPAPTSLILLALATFGLAGASPASTEGRLPGRRAKVKEESVFTGGVPAPADDALGYTRHVLDNGLTVLLHPDRRSPMVAVSVYYHAGTPEAPKARSGMAHLFEHLMFHGSEHVSSPGHMGILKKAGSVSVRGLTDVDRTHYVEILPSANLETALWLESDRMGFLTLDQDALEHEQRVVKRERRQRVDDKPYGAAREKLWEALFPEPHPYSGGLLGSPRDLEAADLADARRFHRRWYGPANATLTLVGDFEPEAALASIEKYFGGLEGHRPKRTGPIARPAPSTATAQVIRHQETATSRPALLLGWATAPRGTVEAATAEILAEVLAGPGSPVSRALAKADGVERIGIQHAEHDRASSFQIKVVARPGADLGALTRAVEKGLDEIRAGRLSEDAVAAARARLRNRLMSELDGVHGLGEMADRIQRDHRLGGTGGLAGALTRQESVDVDSLAAFAREALTPGRRVAVHAVPARTHARSNAR